MKSDDIDDDQINDNPAKRAGGGGRPKNAMTEQEHILS
jgi:hypothetical protein